MNLSHETHRPTKDLDLLAQGDPSPEKMGPVLLEILSRSFPEDGLVFHADSLKVETAGEQRAYVGLTVQLLYTLGKARIPVKIDLGFGDAVTPEPYDLELYTLLDSEELGKPNVLAYPKYTVVAEKFEAMVNLGLANSRVKDFFDLRYLADTMDFDGDLLVDAIGNTFKRRQTAIPKDIPVALTSEFSEDEAKKKQWNAFLAKNKLETTPSLTEVCQLLIDFLMPPCQSPEVTSKSQWLHGSRWIERGEGDTVNGA